MEDFFWEEFFGRNFLGEIFWDDLFGRIFWEEIFVCIGIDLFVKILVFLKAGEGRKISIFRSASASSSHLKIENPKN